MHKYVRIHTGQRLEEEHWRIEVDHAWPTELLKLAYELLSQMGLLWLARPSQLCLRHLEMDELEMVWQTRLKRDMKASR